MSTKLSRSELREPWLLHHPFVLSDGQIVYFELPSNGITAEDCERLTAMLSTFVLDAPDIAGSSQP